MSAGDYINLLKKRQLHNYKTKLSTGNTAAPTYDLYLSQKSFQTVMDSSCIFGTDICMNGIPIYPTGRECIYNSENTFNDIVNVREQSYLPNTDHGLYWKACNGSFNTNTEYFLSAGPVPGYTSSGIASNITDLSFGTNGIFWASDPDSYNPDENYPFCVEWTGYFYCNNTGTWDFSLTVKERDNAFFWIGPNASSGYTIENANMGIYNDETNGDKIINCSFSMIQDAYYPIRIQYDEKGYDQGLTFSFRDPFSDNYITDGSSNLFYTNNKFINPVYLPLKSIPSVPAKLQQPCYKGEKPCATALANSHYRVRWNRKKQENMKIIDSTTFRM